MNGALEQTVARLLAEHPDLLGIYNVGGGTRGIVSALEAAGRAKAAVPDLVMVGSGYTYLQEYVPHAAQAAAHETAKELRPDRFGLGCADLETKHLAPPVGVDADGDDDRH